ncbi:MAG: hypothetical protein PVG38_14575 [Gammaproteobacteria bacterium]|jgi:hypothetical protein
MRKRIIEQDHQKTSATDDDEWLDLVHLAQVELTSEDPGHPIESALTAGGGSGWRAEQAGRQTIRLRFDRPQRIRRVQVAFQEPERQRTQEFVLCWSPDASIACREIVRQQYNFSPPGVDHELEDYAVDLEGVALLELSIVPDISGGEALASLARLRLA